MEFKTTMGNPFIPLKTAKILKKQLTFSVEAIENMVSIGLL